MRVDPQREFEYLPCPVNGCPKKDLRGEAGVHMHVQRAHKKNWSTKPKSRPANSYASTP